MACTLSGGDPATVTYTQHIGTLEEYRKCRYAYLYHVIFISHSEMIFMIFISHSEMIFMISILHSEMPAYGSTIM